MSGLGLLSSTPGAGLTDWRVAFGLLPRNCLARGIQTKRENTSESFLKDRKWPGQMSQKKEAWHHLDCPYVIKQIRTWQLIKTQVRPVIMRRRLPGQLIGT